MLNEEKWVIDAKWREICAKPNNSLWQNPKKNPVSITTIEDDAFDDLHSLQWLKLWNNDLQTLHYELMEPVLDTLIHLDIHSRRILIHIFSDKQTDGRSTRNDIASKKKFTCNNILFLGNPLVCDCEMRWYKRWYHDGWQVCSWCLKLWYNWYALYLLFDMQKLILMIEGNFKNQNATSKHFRKQKRNVV